MLRYGLRLFTAFKRRVSGEFTRGPAVGAAPPHVSRLASVDFDAADGLLPPGRRGARLNRPSGYLPPRRRSHIPGVDMKWTGIMDREGGLRLLRERPRVKSGRRRSRLV